MQSECLRFKVPPSTYFPIRLIVHPVGSSRHFARGVARRESNLTARATMEEPWAYDIRQDMAMGDLRDRRRQLERRIEGVQKEAPHMLWREKNRETGQETPRRSEAALQQVDAVLFEKIVEERILDAALGRFLAKVTGGIATLKT